MSGMDELIAWLRQQLDNDERVARAAQQCTPGRWHSTDEGGLYSDDTGGNGYFASGPWDTGVQDDVAEHIVRWDPARVLAEVEAKRRILDEALPLVTQVADALDDVADSQFSAPAREPYVPELLLKTLAQPYAGWPGWREEWRDAPQP